MLPNWGGRSRHGAPEDIIHKIALKTVKEFKLGRPVDLGAGNSGLIIFSCAFVRQ